MFIFDHPYISDVAANFLKESGAPVLANDFVKRHVPEAANMLTEQEALELLNRQENRWIYSNSENVIGWITEKLGRGSTVAKNIELFKNKHTFREATAGLFPEITYKPVSASGLAGITFASIGKPFIVKPVVGFISAGVYRVKNEAGWQDIRKDLLENTRAVADCFPDEVLNSQNFLIESIIEGEEYAIDAYFDDRGQPVILDILHHRFRDEDDMSDRLYVTSARIIRELHGPLESFLTKIGDLGDFRGMPLHLEVRIDEKGTVLPIEINPLRFAGWCTTDIAWYGHGINIYDYFYKRKKPDWDTILSRDSGASHAVAVIERPNRVEEDHFFDYGKMAAEFSAVHAMRQVNYRKFPLFGFLFLEVSDKKKQELDKLLSLDPQQYVLKKK